MPNRLHLSRNLILFLVLAGILLAGYFLFNRPSAPQATTANIKAETPTEQEPTDDLGLKRKIGQLLLIGFRGLEVKNGSGIAETIKDLNIGGVILFDYDVPSKTYSRNIASPKQVKKLTTDLQSYASTTLFVAIDQEGGAVNRLKKNYGFLDTPSAWEMGQKGTEFTHQTSLVLADQLKKLGFNFNTAPVVDENLNPDNPVVAKLGRSFATTGLAVAQLAEQFILGHQEKGVLTAVKHFPGHGSSTGDSHEGLVDITDTYSQEELAPYYYLQSKGLLKVVITAHIVNRNIDQGYPATLSPLFIENILRKQIGFQGLVISDDMQMSAITDYYGFEPAIILALNAGCDMLLLSNNSSVPYDENLAYRAVEVIFQAVKKGEIKEQRIDQALSRILQLKNTLSAE